MSVDASGTGPGQGAVEGDLVAVVEQLWGPVLETGEVRIVRNEIGAGWHTLEGYRAIPSIARARLLVPDGSRLLAAHAVANYRALLPRAAHARRTALSLAALAGLPAVSDRVLLQARTSLAPTPLTPLTLLRERLDQPDLQATWRVNLNTNRKATLQLVNGQGAPRGLAKFAWEPLSATGVRREAAALRNLAGSLQVTRVPALLAEEDYHGQPVVVAAPLPSHVRGDGSRRRPPTPVEVHDLFPVVRHAPARQLAMCRALANRLEALRAAHPDDATVSSARALLADAMAGDHLLPAASRWHGDFTPWNTARDTDGTLWVWDWETSELDAPAGLDALHWAIAVRQEQHGDPWDGATVLKALADAGGMLRALGVARAAWPTVVAVHVAALADRVLAHALGEGGWQEAWMLRHQLDEMVSTARLLLRTPSDCA